MAISRRQIVIAGAGLAAGVAASACVRTESRTRDTRGVKLVVDGQDTVDGAGVKLRRMLGGRPLPLLDPFLLLDEFKSSESADFIAGFPQHPHRGFETVTLMIDGVVKHRDTLGNHGAITGGGVQWMTAGHGIVHEEMPEASPTSGALWGYQLWVNLPAKLKLMHPRYQDLQAHDVLATTLDDARVRVLAGRVGKVRGPVDGIAIDPLVLDATLAAGARFRHDLPAHHNAFIQLLEGTIAVGGKALYGRALAVLEPGDAVDVRATTDARFFLIAGAPIGEPVARRGPFVMNTDAELQQAFDDYRAGRLTSG